MTRCSGNAPEATSLPSQAKTPQVGRLLQQQIEVTDGEIDRLVYELYGRTEDKIAIVETSAQVDLGTCLRFGAGGAAQMDRRLTRTTCGAGV